MGMDPKDVSCHYFNTSFLIVLSWFEEVQVIYVSTELISADLLQLDAYFRDTWSQGADPG